LTDGQLNVTFPSLVFWVRKTSRKQRQYAEARELDLDMEILAVRLQTNKNFLTKYLPAPNLTAMNQLAGANTGIFS
jgi:hypothetical protein